MNFCFYFFNTLKHYVLVDFLVEFIRTCKNTEIGEYAGTSGNYNIFKLKLCGNITFAQAKNGSPSSLDKFPRI